MRVSEVHVHERYNMGKQFNNDIALMKLAKPVDFAGPYAGPACLPAAGKDYREHQNCMLSGWGLVKRWPQTLADRLQKVTGKIWNARELLRQYYTLPDHVVGLVNPAKAGPPAWVIPAVPLSAPMAVVPTMSLVLSPLDRALALADLVSSLRCQPTEIGFQRSLVAPSKLGVFLYLTEILSDFSFEFFVK